MARGYPRAAYEPDGGTKVSSIFTDKALKSKRRSSDLTTPTEILSSPLKTTTKLSIIVAAAGLIWSVFAKIPIQVSATGYILPYRGISNENADENGYVRLVYDKSPYDWRDDAFTFYTRPEEFDRDDVIRTAKNILQSYDMSTVCVTQNVNCRQKRITVEPPKDIVFKKGTLLSWIQSVSQREKLQQSILNLTNIQENSRDELENIKKKLKIANSELQRRIEYLDRMKILASRGSINRAQILTEETKVYNLQSTILSLNDSQTSLNLKINQATDSLRKTLGETISKTMIFARQDLYIVDVVPSPDDYVKSGESIFLLASEAITAPDLVPIFLTNKDASQVFSGMKGIATPEGYQSAQVGGIELNVISVQNLASGVDEIVHKIGDQAEANYIVGKYQTPITGVVKLIKPVNKKYLKPNSGGYQWTSQSELPFPPKIGDRLTIRITTRKVTPLTLAVPAIKKFFGLASPDEQQKTVSQRYNFPYNRGTC